MPENSFEAALLEPVHSWLALRRWRARPPIPIPTGHSPAPARVNPVWKAMDLRAGFKNGAHTVKVQPPAPGAEQMAISDLCPMIGVPADEALARLAKAGHKVDDVKTTLAALAKAAKTTPEKLYAIILGRP